MIFSDDVAEYNLSSPGTESIYGNLEIWKTRWLDNVELGKVSGKTLKSYSDAVNSLLLFADDKGSSIKIDQITSRYINRYLINYQIELATLKKHPERNKIIKESKQKTIGKNDANFTVLESFENTISQRLTILKMFLKYISENNKEQHDFTKLYDSLAKIKIHEKITDYLTPDELEKLVKFMQDWCINYSNYKQRSTERHAYRDGMLILLYALTGARSEEVVHIKLKDITTLKKNKKEHYVVFINKGKGGKKREVSIEKHYIKHYMKYFQNNMDPECYLSSTIKNNNEYSFKNMHPDKVRVFANWIFDLLGIKKSGLHSCRRGYVTKRIGVDGKGLAQVAKEVGNTSEILQEHYLKHTAEVFLDN